MNKLSHQHFTPLSNWFELILIYHSGTQQNLLSFVHDYIMEHFKPCMWNFRETTEAMISVYLVLALVPLYKFLIAFMINQWKCPLQSEIGLALSEVKFQACSQTVRLLQAWNFM